MGDADADGDAGGDGGLSLWKEGFARLGREARVAALNKEVVVVVVVVVVVMYSAPF